MGSKTGGAGNQKKNFTFSLYLYFTREKIDYIMSNPATFYFKFLLFLPSAPIQSPNALKGQEKTKAQDLQLLSN